MRNAESCAAVSASAVSVSVETEVEFCELSLSPVDSWEDCVDSEEDWDRYKSKLWDSDALAYSDEVADSDELAEVSVLLLTLSPLASNGSPHDTFLKSRLAGS